MSARPLYLPIRVLARSQASQWTCRRCLATQAESVTPMHDVPPSIPATLQTKSPQSQSTRRTVKAPVTTLTSSRLPASETRDRSTRKRDVVDEKPALLQRQRLLMRRLPHAIPPQYLQHCASSKLGKLESEQRAKTAPHKPIVGVVVSAGKMHKTVKVRVPGQTWNKKIKKYYDSHTNYLVHDPNSSLVEGDVVSLHRLRVSTVVSHVVASIVSPFGTPVESRPPIPSPEDRLIAYKEKRFAKLERRSLRRKAAEGNADAMKKLSDMGLDPDNGVQGGSNMSANSKLSVQKKGARANGAILGGKGQKLPDGVLPGGKHEVGKINDRARHNRAQAMRLQEKAEANLEEAKQIG